MERLNNAIIVLLPKKVGASCPADFRPITMIHSFAKLISKVLALRLAPRLNDLVAKNQNAFIQSRTIQDNFKYIQSAAAMIRKKKVPMLLLKLDISKAFDTLGRLLPPATQSIISWWRRLRADWNGVQRSGIDSLFALVSWEVWKERNARCFRAAAVAPIDLFSAIRAEAGHWKKARASGLPSLATPGAG